MNNIARSWCESANMKLEIITPVSIAADYSLTPWFYIFNPKSGEVFYLNTMEWFKFLQRKRILNDYEAVIAQPRKQQISLYNWLVDRLGEHAVSEIQLGNAILSKTQANQNKFRNNKGEKTTLNEIKPHIRLLDGRVYIPGSSIKGVIRQSILFYLLKKNSNIRTKYWNQLLWSVKKLSRRELRANEFKREIRSIYSKLSKDLLYTLTLTDSRSGEVKLRKGALADVLGGVFCSDAISESEVKTEVLQKIDLTLYKVDSQNSISVFRESILPGNIFNFSLTIDRSKLSTIGLKSIEDVENIIVDYYDFINDTLDPIFKSTHTHIFDNMEQGNVYLGGNTGFIHKTLVMALAPTVEDGAYIVKNILNASFRNRSLTKRGDIKQERFSPRTLKATMYNGDIVLTGGVHISVEEF